MSTFICSLSFSKFGGSSALISSNIFSGIPTFTFQPLWSPRSQSPGSVSQQDCEFSASTLAGLLARGWDVPSGKPHKQSGAHPVPRLSSERRPPSRCLLRLPSHAFGRLSSTEGVSLIAATPPLSEAPALASRGLRESAGRTPGTLLGHTHIRRD